jgi:hypothetical protein
LYIITIHKGPAGCVHGCGTPQVTKYALKLLELVENGPVPGMKAVWDGLQFYGSVGKHCSKDIKANIKHIGLYC